MSETTAMFVLRIQQGLRDNPRPDGLATVSAQDLQRLTDRLEQAERDYAELADQLDREHASLETAERENEKLQHDIHQYVQIASDLVAERDEARGLLREARGWCPQPESVGQSGTFSPRPRTSLRDRIDAHLRDTGE